MTRTTLQRHSSSNPSPSSANLSVSANAATMAFGGSLPVLDATVTGLVNGDTFVGLGGSCSAVVNGNPVAADTPTGTYAGAITCSGVDATNYAVTYTAATLTITAAPVFVSDDHVTFQTGTVGAFTMAVTGFPSATFSTTDPLPAGVTLGTDWAADRHDERRGCGRLRPQTGAVPPAMGPCRTRPRCSR